MLNILLSWFCHCVLHCFCDCRAMLWAWLSSVLCFLSVGAALENLMAARVGIMGEGTNACCSAVSIAVRYAAVRKQFAPKPDDTELPIIEYQLHVSSLAQHSWHCLKSLITWNKCTQLCVRGKNVQVRECMHCITVMADLLLFV